MTSGSPGRLEGRGGTSNLRSPRHLAGLGALGRAWSRDPDLAARQARMAYGCDTYRVTHNGGLNR